MTVGGMGFIPERLLIMMMIYMMQLGRGLKGEPPKAQRVLGVVPPSHHARTEKNILSSRQSMEDGADGLCGMHVEFTNYFFPTGEFHSKV